MSAAIITAIYCHNASSRSLVRGKGYGKGGYGGGYGGGRYGDRSYDRYDDRYGGDSRYTSSGPSPYGGDRRGSSRDRRNSRYSVSSSLLTPDQPFFSGIVPDLHMNVVVMMTVVAGVAPATIILVVGVTTAEVLRGMMTAVVIDKI